MRPSGLVWAGLDDSVWGTSWFRLRVPWLAVGGGWAPRFVNRSPAPGFDPGEPSVVVWHCPWVSWMRGEVERLREAGVTVLVDVDDWYRGVRRRGNHEGREFWNREALSGIEGCAGIADGLIVSNPFLKRRWASKLGLDRDRVFVVPTVLDWERYEDLPSPGEPDKPRLVWQGGLGHSSALIQWAPTILSALDRVPGSLLVLVGEDYRYVFGDDPRVRHVPWTGDKAEYPKRLAALGGVGLAVSRGEDFYRGKSFLRVLEYGGCGLPVVGMGPTYEPGGCSGLPSSAGEWRGLYWSDDPSEVEEYMVSGLNDGVEQNAAEGCSLGHTLRDLYGPERLRGYYDDVWSGMGLV